MAQMQLTVPIRNGYNFGVGADLLSGEAKNQPVRNDVISSVKGAEGASVGFEIQRITSTSELEEALGIDAEASYGSPSFGAGVSDRFNFAKKSKVQASSLFMTLIARVSLKILSIDAPFMTKEASDLVDRPDIFAQRFGNVFVRTIERGGIFVGVLRVNTSSREESQNVANELKGTYGAFSLEAKVNLAKVANEFHSEVFVNMFHEGGPVDLAITDPADPLQLLNNANLFLHSFATNPEAVAVPYKVTLAPITIASGPLPPNAADLELAQEVMRFCANRRSVLLDQLNLLQLFVDQPSRFDFSNGANAAEIATAAANTQNDLDLIAHCASAAINSPSKAKFPVGFALATNQRFPTATMPAILPVAKPKPPAPPPTIRLANMVGVSTNEFEEVFQTLAFGTVDEVMAGTIIVHQEDLPGPISAPAMGRAGVEFLELVRRGELSFKFEPREGGDTMIVAQFPSAGTLVPKGSEVILQIKPG